MIDALSKNLKSRDLSQESQRFGNDDREPIEGSFCLAVNEAALLAESRSIFIAIHPRHGRDKLGSSFSALCLRAAFKSSL